jgi:ABC-2 type transport system permease protein
MNGILAIYRREMKSYFVSPIAYIVIGFFLLITGYFFANILSILIERSFMAQMQAQRMGGAPEMDVPGLVIRNFVGVIATVLLFLIPMLTMGVYSEERKRGTMEMLMTSPLTELQIVLGKFLASLSLFLLMLLPTLSYHGIISFYSEPPLPWRIIGSGYLEGVSARSDAARHRFLHLVPDREPDHRRGGDLCHLPAPVGSRLRGAGGVDDDG